MTYPHVPLTYGELRAAGLTPGQARAAERLRWTALEVSTARMERKGVGRREPMARRLMHDLERERKAERRSFGGPF